MTQEERTRTTCWRVADDGGTRRRETYGVRNEKIRKVGSRARKQANRTQGGHGNRAIP